MKAVITEEGYIHVEAEDSYEGWALKHLYEQYSGNLSKLFLIDYGPIDISSMDKLKKFDEKNIKPIP